MKKKVNIINLVGKITWSRKWQPASVFLPRKFHGQRSLAGYSPWGCRVRHNCAAEHAHTCRLHKPYLIMRKVLLAAKPNTLKA